MTSLYELILAEMRERRYVLVNRFIPFYICSIGAHLFNLRNKDIYRVDEDNRPLEITKSPLYYEHKKVPDYRVHILFVAPPGFSKSFTISQFLGDRFSILNKSGIPNAFVGKETEAGWTGTSRLGGADDENEGKLKEFRSYGDAFRYRDGIIGCEEFAVVTRALKSTDQSKGDLVDAVLTTLDRGYVSKTLSGIRLEYHTQVTLWAGTQPARFDMGSGLSRRFFFINFTPTIDNIMALKRGRREGRNVAPIGNELDGIGMQIRELDTQIDALKGLSFSEEFDEYLVRNPHFIDAIYEKLAVGYHLVTGKFDDELHIDLDDELKRLFNLGMRWREELTTGAEESIILNILNTQFGRVMTEKELKRQVVNLGIPFDQIDRYIVKLIVRGQIRRDGNNIFACNE